MTRITRIFQNGPQGDPLSVSSVSSVVPPLWLTAWATEIDPFHTAIANPRERRHTETVPLVRILIDGYSLLHAWPELAPRQPRHSAAARDALIAVLTQYQDAAGVPLSIFFDGQGAPDGTPKPVSSRKVEILYSRPGQTADDLIERVAYRFQPYGEVWVVTNDFAERDMVSGVGGLVQSCEMFIAQVRGALGDFAVDLKHHNRRERDGFRRH